MIPYLLGLAPWLIAIIAQEIARANPQRVDALFAARWYPFIVQHITSVMDRLIPASTAVAPIAAAIAVAWFIIGLIIGIIKSLKSRKWKPILMSAYRRTVAAGLAYLLLLALWGAQYSRTPLGAYGSAGMRARQDSAVSASASSAFGARDSLTEQCADWIRQANWLYPLVKASGVNRSNAPSDILARVSANFANANGKLPGLPNLPVRNPKPLGFDGIASILLIEGIYIPYTFEALVNTSVPMIDLPFVACHETAHALGYAREDEANLIAALVCANSTDPVFRYSGVMSSLRYGLSQLAASNANAYWTLLDQMSGNVRGDFVARQRYWLEKQRAPLARLASRLNDAFLSQAGGASDGGKSYGNVVELLAVYSDQ